MTQEKQTLGTVKPIGGHPTEEILVDGPCVSATCRALAESHSASIAEVRRQAERFIGMVVGAYNEHICPGEVGHGGSAKASQNTPRSGDTPTGLLYGRIQSGKTLGMIVATALAMDNGFRIVIVFTSNIVKLVEQTVKRFDIIEGPIKHASTMRKQWKHDAAHIRDHLSANGLVLVCSKDVKHLTVLGDFLQDIGADRFPALILDDEADQATPDTNTAKRSKGKAVDPSKTHAQIVSAGESIRKRLRHNVFVQVTATPYALLLQHADSPLRPSFTALLEPGPEYTGGESFFTEKILEEGAPPLVYVDEDEIAHAHSGTMQAPRGLQSAIAFFLVASAAQRLLNIGSPRQGQNFLCHTSHKKGEHDFLNHQVTNFVAAIANDFLKGPSPSADIAPFLAEAYARLQLTLPGIPSQEEIYSTIAKLIPLRRIHVVNSEQDPADFSTNVNFIIGGNILGRGLTIENLLVTYYLRQAKTTQMDTMLQHARMFGYRSELMPFTRVFLPRLLAVRFFRIHSSEEALRELLSANPPGAKIPVQVATDLRPTRPGVLDTRSVSAFQAGRQIYPSIPVYKPKELKDTTAKIDRKLRDATGYDVYTLLARTGNDRFVEIKADDAIELLLLLRTDRNEEGWDSKALAESLRSMAPKSDGRIYVYVREMNRKLNQDGKAVFATGAAEGQEQKEARTKDKPTLFLFREMGKRHNWGSEFWYPTFMFPATMPNFVFNKSE